MKSVLISTRPKWCEKICHEIGKEESGKPIYEKRIEVRKTAPKEVPFKAYIYKTKESKMRYLNNRFNSFLKNKSHYTDMGKVIGEFICDKVMFLTPLGLRGFEMREEILKLICLTNDDLNAYGGLKTLYGWHISDLKIYDKPKELSKFKISCNRKNLCYSCNRFTGKPWDICNNTITRPPQSWQFVEELEK